MPSVGALIVPIIAALITNSTSARVSRSAAAASGSAIATGPVYCAVLRDDARLLSAAELVVEAQADHLQAAIVPAELVAGERYRRRGWKGESLTVELDVTVFNSAPTSVLAVRNRLSSEPYIRWTELIFLVAMMGRRRPLAIEVA
jgi:hypothetical protein